MPVWLSIVFAVIGGIGTILGIFGFTAYMSERAKKKAQRRNEQEDHLEELRHQEYESILRNIIREENKPINDRLDNLTKDLVVIKDGLQKDMYIDLFHLGEEFKDAGWCSRAEKTDFDKIYWSYHNLGQNGMADALYNQVMQLPDEKPVVKRTTRARKKKVLVETK